MSGGAMSGGAVAWGGMGVGLVAGAGLALWWWAWVARRDRLTRRIAPYVGPPPVRSRLLDEPTVRAPLGVVALLAAPGARRLIRALSRFDTSRGSIERRLTELASPLSVEQFRVRQVLVAGTVATLGLGLAVLLTWQGAPPVPLAALVCLATIVAFLGCDRQLSAACRTRRRQILAELPAISELLALAVAAGLSAQAALARVARVTRGPLAESIAQTLADVHAGASLSTALDAMSERHGIPALSRLTDAIVTSLERGTPLARVLRDQAQDVRDAAKAQLIELAGKKEVSMIVPVVCLILPVSVIFALFPGLAMLRLAG